MEVLRSDHSRRLLTGLIVTTVCLASGAAHAVGPPFVSHPANAFVPTRGEATFGGVLGAETIYATCGLGLYCEFFRPANLPNGSTLLGVELDGCSEVDEIFGTAPMSVYVIRRGVVAGLKTTLVSKQFEPAMANECHLEYAVPGSPIAIDTFSNDYVVAVSIGDINCQGTPQNCPPLQPSFQAVRLYYSVPPEGTVEPTKPSAFNPLPPP
jgi:hypothetical protein